MSEAIAEMVLPGTYIEVRSEGLIAVGSIATDSRGNLYTGEQHHGKRVQKFVPGARR